MKAPRSPSLAPGLLFAAALLMLGSCTSVAPVKTSTASAKKNADPSDTSTTNTQATTKRSAEPTQQRRRRARKGLATPVTSGPLPLYHRVKTGKLDNGLTYYILRHPVPKKRVRLWLAVNAGSALEDDDQRGLAHFLEHMAFNGTRNFPKNALVDYIERIGMAFGAHLNARTGLDDTVYTLTVPTDDPKLVTTGVQILADWAGGMTLDGAEIDKERGVVLEEWRKRLGASQRRFDKVLPLLFAGSRYADRQPIGTPKSIKTAPHEAIRRFYRDWYRPDMMAVVAVGDISTSTMRQRIKAAFGGLKKATNPRPRPKLKIPPFAKTKVLQYSDPETGLTRVAVQTRDRKAPYKTAADHRQKLIGFLQDGMLRERLREVAQRPDAPFIAAGNGIARSFRAADLHFFHATVKGDGAAAGLEGLMREIERVRRHGFTQTELVRTRRTVAQFYERYLVAHKTTDSKGLAEELLRYHFLGEAMPGARAEVELTRKLLGGITLADVNKLPDAWTSEANRLITVTGPDAKQLPSTAELLKRAAKPRNETLTAWVDKETPKTLVAKAPAPGRIVKTAADKALGTTTWTLGNGLKVIVRPTDFRKNDVRMVGFSPGGASLVKPKDWLTAKYGVGIVRAGGVARLDKTALGKVLAGKRAAVTFHVKEQAEQVNGRAAAKDLVTLLQLVHLGFTAPRMDPVQIEHRKKLLKQYEQLRKSKPGASFQDTLRKWRYRNHPRSMPLSAKEYGEVAPAKALAFFQERFGNAADFTFVFVGDIDLATFKPLVQTYLATLPGDPKSRPERRKDVGKRPRADGAFTLRRGVDKKARVTMRWLKPGKWSPNAVDDALMLKEALSIVLKEELREKLGGVYGVYARAWHNRWPKPRAEALITFNCAPENIDKLKAAVWRVIDRLKSDGGGTAVAEKVKTGRQRGYEILKRSNRYWMTALKWHAVHGVDPKRIVATDKLVARVSAKRIAKVARRILGKKHIVATLLPAQK